VSGHAYNPDRSMRVARVNDVIVQEGSELAPGLKVDEITADGIIFSAQGYRFLIVTTSVR
jgi:general secretion pathway protein B